MNGLCQETEAFSYQARSHLVGMENQLYAEVGVENLALVWEILFVVQEISFESERVVFAEEKLIIS